MNLAKVAERTGISPRMLRYYENMGLISPLRRSNNYRDYSVKDIETIHKIKILNDAGMPLKDIQLLLPCFDLAKKNFSLCPVVQEKLVQEMDKITAQLIHLQRSHVLLKSFLDNGTN
ncbi:MerR family transcriptional regulator [Acinetobacter puyangensis]|uniref:MerR family transcriptional regulator n=1 Tax=Acinetobacter puyangensis TaxID=1096779 RepID=UPI003A4E2D86